MRVTGNGSAASHELSEWAAIDWRLVQKNVRAMQHRLTKASQEGDWRRVKALQRWLTHSFCAKALAVRRVTENQGKRTAGVDREIWDTPQQKFTAIARLKKHGYRPLPLRRVYIPKANGKERPLGIPTMRDRAMQALHLLALDPVLETKSDPNSYGFRKHRSTADAMSQIRVVLCDKLKKSGRKPQDRDSEAGAPKWVLDADIEGFFDNINHDWMIDNVLMDKTVLRKWLRSGVVDRGQLMGTKAGTPQGGIISPALANWTLNGLESELKAHFVAKFKTKKAKELKVHVVRYADDFIVTGRSKELLEQEVVPWVREFLAVRGLRLSESKTKIVHIDDGFDFLGWNHRKYSGKLINKPSKKNANAFYEKLRNVIDDNMTAKQANLVRLLNPMLRGWAQYHRCVSAKEAFTHMEWLLYWRLFRWALRRHPNKNRAWIRQRYWHPVGDTKVFAAEIVQEDGSKGLAELYSLPGTAIEYHKKIAGNHHPYDPACESKWEVLRQKRMENNVRYSKQVATLFMQQQGLCGHCNNEMDMDTGWHDHHIEYRVAGGSDALQNRVLLHPNCHTQVHSQNLKIVKPVPV